MLVLCVLCHSAQFNLNFNPLCNSSLNSEEKKQRLSNANCLFIFLLDLKVRYIEVFRLITVMLHVAEVVLITNTFHTTLQLSL